MHGTQCQPQCFDLVMNSRFVEHHYLKHYSSSLRHATMFLLPVLACLLLFPSFSNSLSAQNGLAGRPTVVLDGNRAQVVVDLAGGSIVNFHLKNLNLNPLVWGDKDASTAPRAMGHFLCLDRWGPPSDAEAKNGMMFHGE